MAKKSARKARTPKTRRKAAAPKKRPPTAGGPPAIRGYLVQTLIALLDMLRDQDPWLRATIEPQDADEKVDILWEYADRTRAVQVKSSQNDFSRRDVTGWVTQLKAARADEYELRLIGTAKARALPKSGKLQGVEIPTPLNLNLEHMKEQAAFRVQQFLETHGLPAGTAQKHLQCVALLTENLALGSTTGRPLTRAGLIQLLQDWIRQGPETFRRIRVVPVCPPDCVDRRRLIEDIVESINRIDGRPRGVELEIGPAALPPDATLPAPSLAGELSPGGHEIFLGILGHRFGAGADSAGTADEFAAAVQQWGHLGSPWITVWFDDSPPASRKPADIAQWMAVCGLREELEPRDLARGYTGLHGPGSFYKRVDEHLRTALNLLAPPRGGVDSLPAEKTDPAAYLGDLLEKTSQMEIRGVKAGRGEAYQFPIEDLFISLTTTGTGLPESGEAKSTRRGRSRPGPPDEFGTEASASVPLHNALRHDRLVVVGDPGSGKTTFLRRVAHTLCQTHLGDVPDAARQRLGVADRTFPVLVRLSALAQHLVRHADSRDAPADDDAPNWLPHYLAAAGQGNHVGLNQAFFQRQLETGGCTVLLDGLDEASDRPARERLSRLIRNATRAYAGCRFVVTSRPAAYLDDVVLRGFAHARIDPLGDDAVATFLARWCDAVYRDSPGSASQHCAELQSALQARPEIRRMARNPVMLTALAVVHWNERRLPEQRADLYESIITWLSRSREQRPGRATADRTVYLLQELAWEMQNDSGGRKTQMPKRDAAEKLLPQFVRGGKKRHLALRLAERFLDEEEVDSGIIVGRGNEVAFWHLTFQEFLAAKAVSSRLEGEQQKMLLGHAAKLYSPDWREVVLLLAGILHEQGRGKVDGFVSGLLKRLGKKPQLADQARCFGLLGAVLSDLEPLKYTVSDPRYPGLAAAVTAVFDRERLAGVPIETRVAAADALGQAGDPRLDHHRANYWVNIPAGRFVMGAQSKNSKQANYDKEAYDWESPTHAVSLDAFCLARYPVTVGQYQRFIADDGYGEQRCWSAGGFGEFTAPEKWDQQLPNPSRPVVGVSWFEAAAFCCWADCRLPTEAQWERAARGTDARKYPWGGEPAEPERLNFDASRIGHPTPVGIYPRGATPEDICDLAGNVWEWCADWSGDYSGKAVRNPRGPEQASVRVMRGGGWADDARFCRAALRNWSEPQFRNVYLGFRVARGPSG